MGNMFRSPHNTVHRAHFVRQRFRSTESTCRPLKGFVDVPFITLSLTEPCIWLTLSGCNFKCRGFQFFLNIQWTDTIG